jgi:hypothetical protein
MRVSKLISGASTHPKNSRFTHSASYQELPKKTVIDIKRFPELKFKKGDIRGMGSVNLIADYNKMMFHSQAGKEKKKKNAEDEMN